MLDFLTFSLSPLTCSKSTSMARTCWGSSQSSSQEAGSDINSDSLDKSDKVSLIDSVEEREDLEEDGECDVAESRESTERDLLVTSWSQEYVSQTCSFSSFTKGKALPIKEPLVGENLLVGNSFLLISCWLDTKEDVLGMTTLLWRRLVTGCRCAVDDDWRCAPGLDVVHIVSNKSA